MKNLNLIAAAAALALSQPAAHAATQLVDGLSFSGFGTLGYVYADSNEGAYRREFQPAGAKDGGSLKVDSSLGLQFNYTPTDWLSATVQSLTMQRTTEEMLTRIEWAFVKVTPIEGLSLRGGRLSLPNFLISDARRVGYANTWLRPANEVYGLDFLNGGLNGVDLSYRLPLGGNGLTITALGGKSSFSQPGRAKLDVDSVRGINAVWDGDGYSVRVGHVQGKPQFGNLPGGLSGDPSKEIYKFTGVGATVDRNNIVLQTEYVRRRSAQFGSMVDANGWYVLGGYRFGNFLPYLQVAKASPAGSSSQTTQTTKAVGLRWDAFSSAAVKFQFERVDTDGTTGYSFVTPGAGPVVAPVTKPVNVLSVALDFVF